MVSLLMIIHMILGFYMMLVLVAVILDWLRIFNVVNTSNRFVATIGDFLFRITEPALRPIRRVIPVINGIDLAPLALYFLIMFVRMLIVNNIGFFM
ncbi:MAG: YggT family protein [Alphaproteobacteria bacterium]